MKRVIPLFLLLSLLSCDYFPWIDKTIAYEVINSSEHDIKFIHPANHPTVSTDFECILGDSTLLATDKGGYTGITIKMNSTGSNYSGYYSFSQMAPYDTLRVFIIDDRSFFNNRKELFNNDIYLQRYDLLEDDFNKLYDKDRNVLQIPYPPDERMKDMKMWPRYHFQ